MALLSIPVLKQRLIRIAITDECITAFKSLYPKGKAAATRFVIYKVSDDQTTVEVEETSADQDYEIFRQKLTSRVDSNGCPCARYAAYGVNYDLGQDGKRFGPVLITWIPEDTPIRVGFKSEACDVWNETDINCCSLA